MKKYFPNIFLSLILEGTAVVIFFAFGYFHRCTLYGFVLYLLPIVRVVGSGLSSSFEQDKVLISKSLFALLFLINSIKWILILWIFKKGYRKSTVVIIIPFVLAMFISFWFSELGF